MREDILTLITATDLASILLGWLIIIGGIIYMCSKGDNK